MDFPQFSGKANKACSSGHKVEMYPKFKEMGGNGGQVSAQSTVCDVLSNSIRQQSCLSNKWSVSLTQASCVFCHFIYIKLSQANLLALK